MQQLAFKEELDRLMMALTEIALFLAGNNRDEVQTVFVFCSAEEEQYFVDYFYRINEVVCEIHNVNEHLHEPAKIEDDTIFPALKKGTAVLQNIIHLFQKNKTEPPTEIKITYAAKEDKLVAEFGFGPKYSNIPGRLFNDNSSYWFSSLQN